MKYSKLIFSFFAIFFCETCQLQPGQSPDKKENHDVEKQLQYLLEQKEYFKLKGYFGIHGKYVSDAKKMYFSAFINNTFNRNNASQETIDTLFRKYPSDLNDSSKAALLLLQRDNYVKAFQYANAAKVDIQILQYYQKVHDSAKIEDTKNYLIIYSALSKIPPEKVTILNDTLHWEKDKVGLMEVPIRQRHSIYYFVFDTRASISVISRSFAKKMGLKILDASYDEFSGITGNGFKSGLGIADSIYLGNILIQNVVFQVVPDEVLNFPQIKFSINGAIGFPIIKQLKEIDILQNGALIISDQPKPGSLQNLALDGSTTVVSFKAEDDTLSFHFDLGATTTELYHTYLEKYKSRILKTGQLKTIQIGGAGGIENRQVYVLPKLHLSIGNKKATIDSVDVLTKPIYPGQKYFGNIGQDLVQKFSEMIINFEYMYIDFK